ncbi:hypothetical protein [Bacteroides uniformis]|uniref:hypothetical protein n=1 Tax=Bacteroides uniformis TaxID=820 RepID=UPI0039B63206
MNKNFIFSLFATMLLLAGCDYNEDNFPGFDDNPVEDVVMYEGDYTGKYPTDGYFTNKEEVQTAVSKMLVGMFPYCDKGSVAKVKVLFGDITEGFKTADKSYTLTSADYDAMGEGEGQPGKFNNFDSNMDVDSYLKPFCTTKYADLSEGKTVSITYKYYSGGVSNLTKTYKKTAAGWDEVELETFVPDVAYTLQDGDYDAMGEEKGQPGKYNNFDSNMDVDFYLPIFLKQTFPYTEVGTTYAVTYKYYANKQTTEQTAIYKYDGAAWAAFDPYADVCEVSTKIAEMAYDGSTWTLTRLLGGSVKLTFAKEDYEVLLNWSLENKPEYKSTKYDTEEYYFGVSTYYPNINNVYSTWTKYYNVNNEYDGKSDEELQAIMDERLAWGIAELVLPLRITTLDSGISYMVSYVIYGGRGNGTYVMSFMYNEETAKFEKVSGPIAQ